MIALPVDLPSLLTSLGIVVQIFLIDLLLSADNALLIAMAVRTLPAEAVRAASLLGTVGAIALRIAMAAAVLFVLDMPYLRLAASTLLLFIALRLTLERADPDTVAAMDAPAQPGHAHLPWRLAATSMGGAITTIMIADAVMSLDNVVAIAAVADGSLALLAFGLALSMPMLIYGSTMIRPFLTKHGSLVLLAGMFLGWIAGSIATSDPAVAPWIASSAPALMIALPIGGALFVLLENRVLIHARRAGEPVLDSREV